MEGTEFSNPESVKTQEEKENNEYIATSEVDFICFCLPPGHNVNDPKVDYSGDLGEGKVGHEPRLKPCWSMLVIGLLSAMWFWWA